MNGETYLTADQAKAFLAAHPRVQWIDVFMFDLNGIARGKRLRSADLMAFADKGFMVPSTCYIMDMRGSCVEETGRLWETGDPDLQFKILADTLAPVSVNGYDPRASRHGPGRRRRRARSAPHSRAPGRRLSPNAGYAPGGGGRTRILCLRSVRQRASSNSKTPDGLVDDPDWQQLYQFEELERGPARSSTTSIALPKRRTCPSMPSLQEAGPGQFEINLKHKNDAAAAALDGLLLKRAVKAAARAHGMEATFMAKPHHDWSGSGMHIHVSLLDAKGNNVFAGDPISPLFRNALGGLRDTMGDFMAVWAQSANAYRRYRAEVLCADGGALGLQQSHGFAARS